MHILDHIADGFVMLDREWRFTRVNAPAEQVYGRARSDLLGKCIWDLYPFLVGTDAERQMRRAADEQVTCEFAGDEVATERFYENRVFPTPDGGVAVHSRDVTRRRQYQHLVESAREYAESIVSTVREPLLVLDRDLRVVSANRSFYKTFKVRPAETEGRAVYELGDGQWDVPALRRLLDEIVPENHRFDNFEVEHDFEHLGRKTMLLNARRFPPEGPFKLLLLTIEDISERKLSEQALRESEERFRGTFENAAVGIGHMDGALRYIRVNQRFCEIVGYSSKELREATCLQITHPDDLGLGVDQFNALMRGELQSFPLEKRYLRKDGSPVWVNMSVSLQRDESGVPAYAIEVIQDISNLKRAEEALRLGEQRLGAELAAMQRLQEVSTRLVQAADSVPLLEEILDAAIAITAADLGNIQLLDPAAGTLRIVASRGFGPEHLEVFAVVEPGECTCGTALLRGERVVLEDVTTSAIFVGKPALDALLSVGVRAAQSTPLMSRSGRLVGMLSTHYRAPRVPAQRDLHVLDLLARQATDWIGRTRSEDELRRAKEAAEAANRAKDEFLANVSHEIRTPFGAILGMTDLVLDSSLTDDQRECLLTVKSAADSLLCLVDELLDFEKIEADKLDLIPADFSLRTMMAEALGTLAVRAHIKGLKLVWTVEAGVPDALVGDPGRLRQVLFNLVGNAIKFTEDGEVAVQVEVAEEPASVEEAVLRFMVRDTGIGIPADGQERIFRAFEQADSSITRQYGGTGLGLTIAARLVGLLGGTIRVESEPGRGSTFVFAARFGRQPHPSEQVAARPVDAIREVPPAASVAPLRILVAEDSEFNSRHLERLLRRWGHVVTIATDGRRALDLVQQSTFDLLLLDLQMPELDGFQVARAIREQEPSTGAHLPIIALTARARPEDRERCLAAGMDDYLSKPVRAIGLFAAIERVVSASGGVWPPPSEVGDRSKLLDPAALLASCATMSKNSATCAEISATMPRSASPISPPPSATGIQRNCARPLTGFAAFCRPSRRRPELSRRSWRSRRPAASPARPSRWSNGSRPWFTTSFSSSRACRSRRCVGGRRPAESDAAGRTADGAAL